MLTKEIVVSQHGVDRADGRIDRAVGPVCGLCLCREPRNSLQRWLSRQCGGVHDRRDHWGAGADSSRIFSQWLQLFEYLKNEKRIQTYCSIQPELTEITDE